MRSVRTLRSLAAVAALACVGGAAVGGLITVNWNLDAPAEGNYELIGQTSFFWTFSTGGLVTTNLLEGVGSGAGGVSFDDFFPPAHISEYANFGYFGRIITRDASGGVIDVSFIGAFAQGEGVGQEVDKYFAGHSESVLVNALDSFDSPEFFDTLFTAENDPRTHGAIKVTPIGRPGDTLDLVAFIGGEFGDIGVKIGTLTMEVVPAPGAAALLAIAGVAGTRRRR